MKKMIVALSISSLMIIASPSLFAGDLGSDDKMNAKVARIKAKQRAQARADGTEGEEGECADVNIGNVENNRGARVTKENIVVITGDVINVDNKCKKRE